jgi:hypothetical protein
MQMDFKFENKILCLKDLEELEKTFITINGL